MCYGRRVSSQVHHVHHHFPPGFLKLAAEFLHVQREILAKVNHMSAQLDLTTEAFDSLIEKVTDLSSVVDGAKTTLDFLEEQVKALLVDGPGLSVLTGRITDLGALIDAKKQELADSIAENTNPED